MNKFIFLIQKTVSWVPRFRQNTKWLEVHATDLMSAREKVYAQFVGWDVSMFWPKTGNTHNPKTIIN